MENIRLESGVDNMCEYCKAWPNKDLCNGDAAEVRIVRDRILIDSTTEFSGELYNTQDSFRYKLLPNVR